jgi:hypothetical protein
LWSITSGADALNETAVTPSAVRMLESCAMSALTCLPRQTDGGLAFFSFFESPAFRIPLYERDSEQRNRCF